MSLDYDIVRQDEESPETSMSAYSDLFAALAFVFLFLYVISSIQMNLQAISKIIDAEKLQAKLNEYELPSESGAQVVNGEEEVRDEVDYEKILKKLAILERQAKEETEKFYKQAQTSKKYEQELISKYQAVVGHVKKKYRTLVVALKKQKTITQLQKTQYEILLIDKEETYAIANSDFKELLAQRKKNMQELEKDKEVIVAEKEKLVFDQKNLQKELGATKLQILALEAEKEAAVAKKENLMAKQRRLQEVLVESRKNIQTLEKDRDVIAAEKEKLVAGRNKLQQKLDKSRVKLVALEKGRKDAVAEKDKLAISQKRLQMKFGRSRKKLKAIEKSYKMAASEKKKLHVAQKKLQTKLAKTSAKLQGLKKGKNIAASEKEKLATIQKKLQKELLKSKAKLLSMGKSQRAATANKEKLRAEQKQLKGKLKKSKAKYTALEKDKAAAEGEKEKLLADRQKLLGELGQSKAQLQDLEKGKAAAEGEKEKLLADQQKLLGELGQSKAQLQDLEKGKAAAEGEKEKLLADLEKLSDELGQNKGKLKDMEKGKKAATGKIAKLLADQQKLQKKLGDFQVKEKLRNDIISRLKDNFDRHGIDAEIDEGTGEVTLPFDKAYFAFDSDVLGSEMKSYLERIIPVYAKSIFSETDVDQYIQSIEVIGSASPIYLGKYVNPSSLSKEARTALHYNMDLSYRRARSIFKYILDKQNMDYDHQKELMVRLKVTGRSYLGTAPMKDIPKDGIKMNAFCKKYDCKKLQSAIIRFNLVD